MERIAFIGIITLAAALSASAADNQTNKTHQVQLHGHTFTLPAGFDIELAAGPPLVDRPIAADFDEQGRLYVADSSGSNDKVEIQLKNKPHRVVRLEDTDGDGRFDRRTIFADKMMFPEGAMWYAGSLYVAAPPSIWKLTDTKGDGVADQRVEWFQGKTLTGCANDLHGPYLGPDGWIYWCKGAFAKQTYERPGKPPFVTRAAHIFRARPDGTGIEPVITGGMDNPVGIAWTPGGELIFTTTFLQHPGGGKRDGLIHAIYGGIYGKDHDPIYEHKWTGPSLMPVLTHLGPAAPAGICRYESDVFGKEYQDTFFVAQFNMHKVSRHILTPEGSTFACKDEDFLVSDNLDFHPTGVLEDADGSLLVLDTGGWYKLCCPSSQLHKPDVLGAIYRIRKHGVRQVDDPRGLKLQWEKLSAAELTHLLDVSRPAVRKRAIQALADMGKKAVDLLVQVVRESKSAEAKRNAVWTLSRIAGDPAGNALLEGLNDSDETVRQAAIRSVSVSRDPDLALLAGLLISEDAEASQSTDPAARTRLHLASLHNRRAAFEAIGRSGKKGLEYASLLPIAALPCDRALEHSITYMFIELADRAEIAKGLKSAHPRIRRIALAALDQMDGGNLKPSDIANDLVSTDGPLRETAWWIASHHPEWGSALAGILRDRLVNKNLSTGEREELAAQLAKFARSKAVQGFLAERLTDSATPLDARRVTLRAMTLAGLRDAPESWVNGLVQILGSGKQDLLPDAVATARAWHVPEQRSKEFSAALLQLANQSTLPATVRLTALVSISGGLREVEPPIFTFLRTQLEPERQVGDRSMAAEIFSRSKLSSEQLITLTESLEKVGPLELDRVVETFGQSTDERVGLKLVAALKNATAMPALRADILKQRLAKFNDRVQNGAKELLAALSVDQVKQKERLEQLLGALKGGDVRRGQAVFNSTKASCSACHAIGYLGGNVGPDLTHIGKIRSERDLLESIVFPSASFVRSYEPVVVSTKDGRFVNGLIRKETPDEIVLATGVNQEARVARGDIEAIVPSKTSIMPAGLDTQLSPRELADLVAFLKGCQ
jgi:putative membrane-bound dehydrogenase-like protein